MRDNTFPTHLWGTGSDLIQNSGPTEVWFQIPAVFLNHKAGMAARRLYRVEKTSIVRFRVDTEPAKPYLTDRRGARIVKRSYPSIMNQRFGSPLRFPLAALLLSPWPLARGSDHK
ncbi:hypothetical protein B296_00040367 [Ensete ventricosum]|uniref:Uncharacterized protein n=1 Tax=Ensete ventricosum TaxID=4639 RepID=A0A426ZFQ5_ENSVE|nr:hypothetical protein B296_00040367 [Ensete ventricosum]